MRQWQGIRADTADTAQDGCLLAVNPTFFLEGELRRRAGMEGFTNQSGTSLSGYYSGMTGNWAIFATSTGTVVAVAAP